jgi:hypothetical protein
MGTFVSNNTRNLWLLKLFKSSALSGTSFQTKEEQQETTSFLAFDYPKRLKMK